MAWTAPWSPCSWFQESWRGRTPPRHTFWSASWSQWSPSCWSPSCQWCSPPSPCICSVILQQFPKTVCCKSYAVLVWWFLPWLGKKEELWHNQQELRVQQGRWHRTQRGQNLEGPLHQGWPPQQLPEVKIKLALSTFVQFFTWILSWSAATKVMNWPSAWSLGEARRRSLE